MPDVLQLHAGARAFRLNGAQCNLRKPASGTVTCMHSLAGIHPQLQL